MPDWSHEIEAGAVDGLIVCGVDEVGRGPLAGPVLACAVVLDRNLLPDGLASGLDDSKRLSEQTREAVAALLKMGPGIVYAIGEASVAEIDRFNILQATLMAMARAVEALPVKPDHALIDGNRAPKLSCGATCIVKGDGASLSIAAASILAKVTRDRIMRQQAEHYPNWHFDTNKGYPCPLHKTALQGYGPSAIHRRTWVFMENFVPWPAMRVVRTDQLALF